MAIDHEYAELSKKTAQNLKTIAQSPEALNLSRLNLLGIDAVVERVERLVLAGRVRQPELWHG